MSVCRPLLVTRCDQMLPGGDQVLLGVTRYSVLAYQEHQEKCFGAAGMARKVFWRSGNGYKSVMALREWQVKCFGIVGVTRKVFWGRPDKINMVVAYDDSAP